MVLSLTSVPAGVALLFRKPRPVKHNVVTAQQAYRPALDFALARRWPVVAGAYAEYRIKDVALYVTLIAVGTA